MTITDVLFSRPEMVLGNVSAILYPLWPENNYLGNSAGADCIFGTFLEPFLRFFFCSFGPGGARHSCKWWFGSQGLLLSSQPNIRKRNRTPITGSALSKHEDLKSIPLAKPRVAVMFSCRTLTRSAKSCCRTLHIAEPKALNVEKDQLPNPGMWGSLRKCPQQLPVPRAQLSNEKSSESSGLNWRRTKVQQLTCKMGWLFSSHSHLFYFYILFYSLLFSCILLYFLLFSFILFYYL